MKSGSLRGWFKTLAIITACIIAVPLVLFLAIAIALIIPSVQQKTVTKAAQILSDKTGVEVSVGHFSVRPPMNVLLKDVFVGGKQNDTLAFISCLDARLNIEALPDSIAVDHLCLSRAVAHTEDLIPSVKIDGRIGRLSAGVQAFNIKEFNFPITDAVLEDADITIGLAESDEAQEEAPADSTSTAIAIDLQQLSVKNLKFALEPMGLNLSIDQGETSTHVDLGASCFTVRHLDIVGADFGFGDFSLPVGKLEADAVVDLGNSLISSERVFISVPQLDARATLSNTVFDLEKMLVRTCAQGNYAGSDIALSAEYDIDDEQFKAFVDLGRIDVAKILDMPGSEIIVEGQLQASGCGIDPKAPGMTAELSASLDSCRYNGIDISGLRLAAELKDNTISGTLSSPVHYRDTLLTASLVHDSHFVVSDFLGELPGLALESGIKNIALRTASDNLDISRMDVAVRTGQKLSDVRVEMPGISLSVDAAAHALELPAALSSLGDSTTTLAKLESMIAAIPEVNAKLKIKKDNPLRPILQKNGLDLNSLSAALTSEGTSRKLEMKLLTPELKGEYNIPALNAALNAVLKLEDNGLNVGGKLNIADLVYDGKALGNQALYFDACPDEKDPEHLSLRAHLDDIPLDLAKEFVELPEDIGISGLLKARAVVSGLPEQVSIFAGVTPVGVAAQYKPFDVQIRLGEQEITLEDKTVNMNGLEIIGADDSSIKLFGTVDLDTMNLDLQLESDRFEPVKLPKDGPIPVYGTLLTRMDGRISGPVDKVLANIDIGILPETDITYPIDKKNLAQVDPEGTVNVIYSAESGLKLGGSIDVPRGKIFYSPKFYPMMPFTVDSGSCIKFNGDINSTILDISASQKAKATYKPVGEVSRMVDFITGVMVQGDLQKIDISFYLDAPNDPVIQKELSELPEEEREGLAAVLLATGMYASESNEAVQMEGYALSSIVQSKLNAATANKWGNKVNLDFGVAKGKHGKGVETTDYTLNVSKSFFNDKLSIRVGGSVSDNAEVNKNSTSFINNLSADYKLDRMGTFKARIFSMKEFNNIIDGELVKSGAGVLYDRTYKSDDEDVDRSLDLKVEGNLVYRSNNQLGPDASVSIAKKNLFRRDDIFTTKIKGAYYWNLNQRQMKDPTSNDTYVLGVDFSLSFPYLQLGETMRKYSGQTMYRLGYLNENISGDYSLHKIYGGLDYCIRQNQYITHSFSPASLSVVLAHNASGNLAETLTYNELIKLFASNEFSPSLWYSFSFNNYRNKNLAVNTALDLRLKESANLISGIMAACGRDFFQRDKTLLGISYDQYVKLHFELRNKFRLSRHLELATRAIAGAVLSYGNSVSSPLSEAYSIGGPNSLRAFSPRSIGPGDFKNANYSSPIFHTGDMKLEVNAELRFPIFWKINGAVFVDAGNVWNQRDPRDYMSQEDIDAVLKAFNLTKMYNSHIDAATFLDQIALGTGAGLRLDYESIVIRLDLGIAIHAPYDTGRAGYYNIPNFWKDGLRLNFGVGYPF